MINGTHFNEFEVEYRSAKFIVGDVKLILVIWLLTAFFHKKTSVFLSDSSLSFQNQIQNWKNPKFWFDNAKLALSTYLGWVCFAVLC